MKIRIEMDHTDGSGKYSAEVEDVRVVTLNDAVNLCFQALAGIGYRVEEFREELYGD